MFGKHHQQDSNNLNLFVKRISVEKEEEEASILLPYSPYTTVKLYVSRVYRYINKYK